MFEPSPYNLNQKQGANIVKVVVKENNQTMKFSILVPRIQYSNPCNPKPIRIFRANEVSVKKNAFRERCFTFYLKGDPKSVLH